MNELGASTLGDVANDETVTKRMRDLFGELAEELGQARGWKAEVARRAGISPAYVSRIVSGDPKLRVGTDVMRKVSDALNLDETYFFVGDPKGRTYREWLRDSPAHQRRASESRRTLGTEIAAERAAWNDAFAVAGRWAAVVRVEERTAGAAELLEAVERLEIVRATDALRRALSQPENESAVFGAAALVYLSLARIVAAMEHEAEDR